MVDSNSDTYASHWEFDISNLLATHPSGLKIRFLIPYERGGVFEGIPEGDFSGMSSESEGIDIDSLIVEARQGLIEALGGEDRIPEIIWIMPTFG